MDKEGLMAQGYTEIRNGDTLTVQDGGKYFIAEGSAHVTQLGGDCRVYGNATLNLVQNGGDCRVYGNATLNLVQNGGDCGAYGNATINNTQTGGNCVAYGNATINNAQTGGKCWAYDNATINNVQNGGDCVAYGNATINNTQTGGDCRAYGNATINNTQTGIHVDSLGVLTPLQERGSHVDKGDSFGMEPLFVLTMEKLLFNMNKDKEGAYFLCREAAWLVDVGNLIIRQYSKNTPHNFFCEEPIASDTQSIQRGKKNE